LKLNIWLLPVVGAAVAVAATVVLAVVVLAVIKQQPVSLFRLLQQ
jgi:hypothetical protein